MNCTDATENVARAFGFDSREGDARDGWHRDLARAGSRCCHSSTASARRTCPARAPACTAWTPANLTRANAYRATMEGATFALRNGFDALVAAGLHFDAIRLTGGGSRSAAWRQMVADVFDLPVQVPAQAEGAAFGAALQAFWAHCRALATRDIAAITRAHVHADAGAVGATTTLRDADAYRESYRPLPRSPRRPETRQCECGRNARHEACGPPVVPFPLTTNPNTTMNAPFIGTNEYFPGIGRHPVRRPRIGQPAGLQALRRNPQDRVARPWPSTCALPSATGTASAMPATIRSGPARATIPWDRRADADGARGGQARRGVRVLHQARRALLLLPRHRPGARCRRHRRLREEPAAHGRARQGAPAGDRRQAAVGYRQSVQPSALHERRGDQSGLRRGRARRGAGQGRARRDGRARRRELCVLGWARRLCLARQHRT